MTPCLLVSELRSQFSDDSTSDEDGPEEGGPEKGGLTIGSTTSDRQKDNDRDTTVTFEIDGQCSLIRLTGLSKFESF